VVHPDPLKGHAVRSDSAYRRGVLANLAAVALLAAMVVTGLAAWRGVGAACLVLALQSLVWLHVDEVVEGPVLLTLSDEHGFVLADMVAVAGVVVAAVAAVARWRAGRHPG
jgi:hypothetical protein